MNPLFGLLLKQLPRLLPAMESVLRKAPPTEVSVEDGRIRGLEQSLRILAERSDELDARLRRIRIVAVVAGFLSVAALIAVFVRT